MLTLHPRLINRTSGVRTQTSVIFCVATFQNQYLGVQRVARDEPEGWYWKVDRGGSEVNFLFFNDKRNMVRCCWW